ncbi:dTDP-glucose 4,6-dehydratase [Bradyrhizobium sp. CB1650]|uniref:dTDP-glucose 4,6-dehydratase n=1 Tax=Bradyrhizobium sp. CB1650 TaxID=3039153 RepID=UPI002435778E|nr:dTDP-glucose 4,6-dehydratase [Bradyrhizobium sp. CB1650]WGD55369.1 dTDP-glucose 4,6-dehydratase [Bradyrhizobium sp. CB1650]
MANILITGGAGFIGQNLVHTWRKMRPDDRLTVIDAMTYAANITSLEPLIASRQINFVKGSINDGALLRELFDQHQFTRVVHLAAESHVDRSIEDPEAFLTTNVLGTFTLLKTSLDFWRAKKVLDQARFLHVSTDEVYGSLNADEPAFCETTPYRPNSPYAASKAASDHLVRSFEVTYGLPALITNCSNNYGPYQHPEKLIPLMIVHALEGKALPIYGDGSNIRDWLHVSEHCEALIAVIERGRVGETYNVGGDNEQNNRNLVGLICETIDRVFAKDSKLKERFPGCPAAGDRSCRSLITFVTDRPGHDHRYAINATKLANELGKPCSVDFAAGLEQTVRWYIENEAWWRAVINGGYRTWIETNYGYRSAV